MELAPVCQRFCVGVTSEVEADWRWLAGYLVKFQIQDVLKLTVRELDILRIVEELSTLNSQIRLKFPFSVPGILVLPDTFLIDSLNAYIDMTTLPTVFEARLPAF